jgi:cytosine/adenosine deaminase-related metal-dependent hydrolase
MRKNSLSLQRQDQIRQKSEISRSAEASRRDFFKSSAVGLVVAAASALPAGTAEYLQAQSFAQSGRSNRILIKGGIVLTLDRSMGDFANADVLIEGKKIVAVQPNLKAEAQVIDASNTVVMPGFIDTHHHQYETILRSILADGLLTGPKSYQSDIQGILTPAYRPEDASISELVASISQINAGVTTGVDTSQVSHTPEHTDACIDGLAKAGRRTLFAYSNGTGSAAQYPQDIRRLRKQYFSSDDQLLTLAMGGGPDADIWALARDVGAPIVNHIVGNSAALEQLASAGLMRSDNEYIHCVRLTENVWKRIADTGGKVSIATAIEMQMRHGMPPIQTALDHGIRPSLSVDVETNMAADMFTVMRSTFTLQRTLLNERALAGEQNLPPLLTCRDVLEMATIEGARVSHLDHKVGTLTPGKEADIILLRTDAINVMPINNVPGAVVTLMDTSNVDTVLIAGKIMKRGGKLVGVDLSRIRRTVEASRDAVLARAGYPRNLFGSCCAVSG